MPENRYQYSLMPAEIEEFKKFQDRHQKCSPEKRAEMIEETAEPVLFAVTLNVSSVGMYPVAHCNVCGASGNISCDERLESL